MYLGIICNALIVVLISNGYYFVTNTNVTKTSKGPYIRSVFKTEAYITDGTNLSDQCHAMKCVHLATWSSSQFKYTEQNTHFSWYQKLDCTFKANINKCVHDIYIGLSD